jgi:diaminohydroxyphosphoribosylaminopyrimidine deaminase / 5-amino-6-(5-phosphoribosylamino)uracil reductase
VCPVFAFSALGLVTTSPNPAVGCVILDIEGWLIGEGYHRRKGEAHAEVNALAAAGDRARGGVAVVTLEPCNHHGITPPCHQALIDAGIRRVVVALLDPTSRGEGGVSRLRADGVSVEVGVLENEALLVLGPWLESLRTGLPVVTWLYGLSDEGEPVPMDDDASGPARADAHMVAVGVDVVISDDGTIAEGVPGGHAWTPRDLRLDSDSDSAELLTAIAELGARTVLLRGSGTLAASYLEAGMIEKVICYVPFSSPSSTPPAMERIQIVPNGYRLQKVTRLDGWVRIEAAKD